MKLTWIAALAMAAVLSPLSLMAQGNAMGSEGPGTPSEDRKAPKIAWERDFDTAAKRADKEGKTLLALYYIAGGG